MIIIFSQLFFSSNWARSYQYWAWSYEKKKTIDFFRPLNQFSHSLVPQSRKWRSTEGPIAASPSRRDFKLQVIFPKVTIPTLLFNLPLEIGLDFWSI